MQCSLLFIHFRSLVDLHAFCPRTNIMKMASTERRCVRLPMYGQQFSDILLHGQKKKKRLAYGTVVFANCNLL
ncbi:hypothetical protein I3760_09G138300 [Carya illinoinensis]|uniref:Uncharacterized protein n=1 Tax=Carya illinoinensis TaxID=32201 RepID=A0A922E3X5_CARIL|nr:hypothetical protein I3760_09G138300 [Carya illinoinensis]KAG6696286.1 hypothetical protein I3842_09G140700 [Carya illinoinensis]